MYFQYWLVLFSAWVTSNLMGLVISDSFKTIVTIYILIPFLVIPQIILSGIIVKFEKLNPAISSPSNIPLYGEIITARWAYEALAVYQFKENVYEKQFYIFDKRMSVAEYKKNYWIRYLKNKIDDCERNLSNKEFKSKAVTDLTLIRNEIGKELQNNESASFKYMSDLYVDKISPEAIEALKDYIEKLNTAYIKLYNKANVEKDNLISDLQVDEKSRDAFLKLKRGAHNESLVDFVTNSGETDRIVEYKEHLYQKVDPIFLDPESHFIKSHFYAPRKQFLNTFYSTYWVNIIVMWIMTLIFYFILYFRLFKRFLDSFEHLSEKFFKPNME